MDERRGCVCCMAIILCCVAIDAVALYAIVQLVQFIVYHLM